MTENTVFKTTKQRTAILDILDNAVKPQSAEDIFLQAKLLHQNIAITTVYRNLETLVNHNKVEKCVYKDGIARYNICNNSHKHYLICGKCNQKVPINSCPIKEIEEELAEKTGFIITGHNIEIYGYCKECWENLGKNEQN